MQQLQDLETSIKDSGALPYLISGGVGALAGGGLAASVSRRGESKLQRLGRILGTGALSGLATGGAHKLMDYGVEQASTALPKDDISPEQNLISGPGTRAAAAGLIGASIAGKTHLGDRGQWRDLATQNPGLFGTNEKGFSKYPNFRVAKDDKLWDLGKAPGASNNSYKDLLDHYFTTHPGRDIRRGDIESQLKSLGINATDNGFKSLDKLRFNHGLGNTGTGIGSKLADFVLRNEVKAMHLRNQIVPALTKITGRTPMGVLGRVGAVTAATMYPEIIEGTGNRLMGDGGAQP